MCTIGSWCFTSQHYCIFILPNGVALSLSIITGNNDYDEQQLCIQA